MLDAETQVRHRHGFIVVVICSVKILVVKTGKMQNRFSHRLAGDCACIGTHSSHRVESFNNGDAFSCFYALNRGALSAGSRTDNDQIKRLHSVCPARWIEPEG